MSINIKILDVPGMHSKTLREKNIFFVSQKAKREKVKFKCWNKS
jgi:hypothetical protein